MKILNIVGARPNFMKIAPIHRLMMKSDAFQPILTHTGQHYDRIMSKIFFDELELPEPDIYLGVGSGSHAQQTGEVMMKLEQVMTEHKPDMILVVGDVNSTLAASLVASKLCVPIAHVEAGLRSFDRSMPEEINRIVTDSLAELLFITEESGRINLRKEGVPERKIFFVGNVMIDSLLYYRKKAADSRILAQFNLDSAPYTLLTLHRPSNVDDPTQFKRILDALEVIQKEIPIIFPIHPRSKKMIGKFEFTQQVEAMKNLQLVDPLGYLDFLHLMDHATLVLTDSGGIQEETTVLGIPCLTLRENTERPVTIDVGTNVLVGMDPDKIIAEALNILSGKRKVGAIPELWDGNSASRIVRVLEQYHV